MERRTTWGRRIANAHLADCDEWRLLHSYLRAADAKREWLAGERAAARERPAVRVGVAVRGRG